MLQTADGFSIEGILGLVRADDPDSAGLEAGPQEVLYQIHHHDQVNQVVSRQTATKVISYPCLGINENNS